MAEGRNIAELAKKIKVNEDSSANAPVIKKHTAIATFAKQDDNNLTPIVITKTDSQGDDDKSAKITPKAGIDIVPITKNVQSIKLANSDEPEKAETKELSPEVSDFVSQPDQAEPLLDGTNEESDTILTSEQKMFEASDSLPDENDKRTSDITDNMQSPKIYDTNEYFVPIKNTSHNHGGAQIILAGLLSASIVAVIVGYLAMYVL
jgi:hypothetical protein